MYDYIVNKPELNEDTLAHFGIKGMKWRKRKKKYKEFRDKLNEETQKKKNLRQRGFSSSTSQVDGGGVGADNFGRGMYSARKRLADYQHRQRNMNVMKGDSRFKKRKKS